MNLTDCFVDASADGQSFKLDRNGIDNALASIYRGFAANAFPDPLKASQFQQPRTGETFEKHAEEHKLRLDAFMHQYDRLKTGFVDADQILRAFFDWAKRQQDMALSVKYGAIADKVKVFRDYHKLNSIGPIFYDEYQRISNRQLDRDVTMGNLEDIEFFEFVN